MSHALAKSHLRPWHTVGTHTVSFFHPPPSLDSSSYFIGKGSSNILTICSHDNQS